jgi:putative transposase
MEHTDCLSTFAISEICYRYQPTLSSENAEIADWLVRLTHKQCNWGFGLSSCTCITSKAMDGWNRKRVYHFYLPVYLTWRA